MIPSDLYASFLGIATWLDSSEPLNNSPCGSAGVFRRPRILSFPWTQRGWLGRMGLCTRASLNVLQWPQGHHLRPGSVATSVSAKRQLWHKDLYGRSNLPKAWRRGQPSAARMTEGSLEDSHLEFREVSWQWQQGSAEVSCLFPAEIPESLPRG